MYSYDVTSLYTNVPVQETIDLTLSKLFTNDDQLVLGLNKEQYKRLLELSTAETYFMFNDEIYQQTDGLSMGSPVAPALANIFMSVLEQNFMNQCPAVCKPLFYKRYMDDTFVLFANSEKAAHLKNYINSRHPNIQFTMDKEQNCTLPFLDINVARNSTETSTTFVTSIYRKPTFSGLGTSFYSFVPFLYKINSILTLVHRAYKLSSNYYLFHTELNFLRNFFSKNGFPRHLIENKIGQYLTKQYNRSEPLPTAPKKTMYFKFPYYGDYSNKMEHKLKDLLTEYFPQFDFRIVFSNQFTIQSFFTTKEKLPTELRSDIIYMYTCGDCNASYIGQSSKTAKFRWCQHLGISHRTGQHLTRLTHSAIRDHGHANDHHLCYQNCRPALPQESGRGLSC